MVTAIARVLALAGAAVLALATPSLAHGPTRQKAVERIEINASPERLDIHGPLIRSAKAKGAKFVINTDAHHPKHFYNMRYGIVTARRGWLEAGDVINTLPRDEFLKAIQRT